MWLICLLALSSPVGGDDEAEQLFRRMELKLDEAKSLELAVTITYGEAAVRNGDRLTGTLALTGGNKLRLQVKGGEKNETAHLRVSDGSVEVLTLEGDKATAVRRKAAKNLTATFRTVVARTGVLPALLPQVFASKDFKDLKRKFPVFGFKLGKKERVGERETQRVDYVLGVKGEKGTYPATVWIDLKTGLPVKRRVMDGGLPWFTENYDLTLDRRLDPKMFELPGNAPK